MNYRHSFHAGNFADVVKHAALALALERLRQKDAPFCVMDSHAGRGLYDLTAPEAQRAGEYRLGVARVMAATDRPAALAPYVRVIEGLNPDGDVRRYPGSPLVAQSLMRPQDRLILCEKHPEEAEALRRAVGRDGRVHSHARDGYEALGALLPPPEKRGLVLIDPPFEAKDEWARLTRALSVARKRFAHGSYMIWLPIKDAGAVRRFYESLGAQDEPKAEIIALELAVGSEADRMQAASLVCVNPPWGVRDAMVEALPWLARLLAQGPGARGAVKVLG